MIFNRTRYLTQDIAKILWMGALSTIALMILILFQILKEGLPVLKLSFFTESPKSMGREGGILSTIIGTVALTVVAILVGAPLGVGTAIFLREYTRESKISRMICFGTDCLAGVPSIIFGLFGFVFFVIKLNMGWSILSGGLTLAAMILPTVISTAEESIKAVPYSYREVSYSLGGTRWQTVTRVVVRNALPGIFTGILLSMQEVIALVPCPCKKGFQKRQCGVQDETCINVGRTAMYNLNRGVGRHGDSRRGDRLL